jgi:predicted acylesterase/phospholipase RssA
MIEPVRRSAARYAQEQFEGEKRYCDVVMKGGVTSGVVYPLAVTELATKYRLKNIGGASAGAIAAAIAAAAEHARDRGGFLRLAAIPDEISGKLLSLFQPRPRLRPLFEILRASVGRRGSTERAAQLITATVEGYGAALLVGAAPGIGLAFVAALGDHAWSTWLAAALTTLVGTVVALGLGLWRSFFVDLPAHGYGICPGLSQPGYPSPALTEWIADKLDEVAGRSGPDGKPPQTPLTFGDLVGPDPAAPRINLEIVTTNVTAGRPHRIPFDTHVYMFNEREWQSIFPPRILEHLIANSHEVSDLPGYRWLPPTSALPVVVAVRMSLSFPLLVSAVPLHARDYTLLDPHAKKGPRRSWFSDGGICSNFPIHFFDRIWPSWPTFGITLEKLQEDSHHERVFLPSGAGQGILRNFSDVESLPAFLAAIIDTMQEWRDNLQSTLPGFRDRIVHVRLDDNEGGLNLDMPAGLVQSLSAYGQAAGSALCQSFDWDAHRWTRYVISMARFEATLEEMRSTYDQAAPLDESLSRALERLLADPPRYEETAAWRDAAGTRTASLMREAAAWQDPPRLCNSHIPKPEVDLRITPRV